MPRQWHIIIPFYHGRNRYVTRRGGAPVNRKQQYLSRTVASIRALLPEANILVCVQDQGSEDVARGVCQSVVRLQIPEPCMLPYLSVARAQQDRSPDWRDDDIVGFTEDDQVLQMDGQVRDDILEHGAGLAFSPHRWSRLFLFLRRRHRPLYRHGGRWGVLENVDRKKRIATSHRFRRNYAAQPTKTDAYAACWFTHVSTFRRVPLPQEMPLVGLESGSFAIHDAGVPVLKLSLADNEDPGRFIVDHLSGYDFNRRLL